MRTPLNDSVVSRRETISRPPLPWECHDDDPYDMSINNEFANSHDLMIMVLHQQLLRFVVLLLENIAVDSVDDEITLDEFFESIDKQNGGVYTRLMASHASAAKHSFPALLQMLIGWRKRSMLAWTSWAELGCTITDSRVQLLMDEKKINATDYLFCKILMILLGSWNDKNAPSDDVVLDTIDSGFSSIKSLSKQKDLKEPEGIISNRRDVLDMFANLIGKISAHRFDFVVERFYHELDNAIEAANIPECSALLSGIRYLHVTYRTEEDLRKAQAFLDYIAKSINKKTKLELLTSSCLLYGDILLPLSDAPERERVDYAPFRAHITEMFHNSKKIWKRLKESTPGLTMEVGILCNGKKEFLAQQPFSVLERLTKSARLADKNRPAILNCSYFLLMTMFEKYDNTSYDFGFDLILEKVAREMFPSPSKKPITPHPESVQAFVDIALLISVYRLPYAVKHFVQDFVVASDNNFERILIGLKTFAAMCDRVAVAFDKTNLSESSDIQSYTQRGTSLRRCLSSNEPCHLSTQNIEEFREKLEKVFLLIDSHVGDLLLYTQPQDRKYSDYEIAHVKYLPKEKQAYVYLLRACVDCIRRVPPQNLSIDKLIQMLAKYCFHLDTEVRLQARELLLGMVKTKPAYRSIIIEIFASFIVNIPENQPIYIHKAVHILIQLLSAWHDPVVLNIIDPDMDFFHIPGHLPTTFPSSILEGCTLYLLCNTHVLVRDDAFRILDWTKRVNEGLPRDICDPTPGIIMILHEIEKDVLLNILIDPTLLATDTYENAANSAAKQNSIQGLVNSSTMHEHQTTMARCIGEIIRAIRTNCNKSLQVGFSFAEDRLHTLHTIITTTKRTDTPGFLENLILWRNYSIIVGGSGSLGSDGITKMLGALHSPLPIVREFIQYVLYYMCNSSIVIVSQQISTERRKKDFRLELAHIFRVICDKHVFESKDKAVTTRCLEFFDETITYLNTPVPDGQWLHHLYLSYDLFRSAALLYEHIYKNQNKQNVHIGSPQLREALFTIAIHYSGYGTYSGEQQAREAKMKECTTANPDEISQHIEYMHFWAIRCIQAVLCHASDFIVQETLSEAGPIFALVTDIFENNADKKFEEIIVTLVKQLIQNSTERQAAMFKICIDKSFQLSSQKISQGYFVTVVDVITSNVDTTCKLPVLLTLAIYKLSDSNFQVRRAAVKLLHWMSTRFFRTADDTFKLFRSTSLGESSIQQMQSLTVLFSSKHPELRFDILKEVLIRIGQVDRLGQRKMIQMISSWFVGVTLSEFDDSIDEILCHFCVFTHIHGEHRPDILEELWKGIAQVPENIALIVRFMVHHILDRQTVNLLRVFRKIAVFLTRCLPEAISELFVKEITAPESYGVDTTVAPIDSALLPACSATWSFTHIFIREQPSTPLTRRSFAMIMISDAVNEQYSVFDIHVPLILTSIFIEMDSHNSFTSHYSKILLENLIHCHVTRQGKPSQGAIQAMNAILRILDDSDPDGPLWIHESISPQNIKLGSTERLVQVAQLVLQALVSREHFKEEWANTAIQWAMDDPCVHVTERCLQLYRALAPELSPKILEHLIAKLVVSIQTRTPLHIQISFEIMETLKVVPKSTGRHLLLSMPQLFWTACAMLNTVMPLEFVCACQLISVLLDQMRVATKDMQMALLSTLPQSWNPSFHGIIPFLLKGLCSPKTEVISRELLHKISTIPSICPFHTSRDLRVLGNIIGLCPHLLCGMGRGDTIVIADTMAAGLLCFGELKLSQLFKDYGKFTTSAEGMRRFIHEIAGLIAELFFPTHELMVFGLLTDMLENGPESHQRSILVLFEVLLSHTNLQRSPLNNRYLSVLAPTTKYLDTPHWTEALNVLEMVLFKSSDHSKQTALKTIPSKESLVTLQSNTPTWLRRADTQPVISALQEALNPTVNPNPPPLFVPDVMPTVEVVGRSGNTIPSSPARSSMTASAPQTQWGGIRPSRLERENSTKFLPSFMGSNRASSTTERTDDSSGKVEVGSSSPPGNPIKSPTPLMPRKKSPTNPPPVTVPTEFRAPSPAISERSHSTNSTIIRGPGPPPSSRRGGRGNPRGNPRGRRGNQ